MENDKIVITDEQMRETAAVVKQRSMEHISCLVNQLRTLERYPNVLVVLPMALHNISVIEHKETGELTELLLEAYESFWKCGMRARVHKQALSRLRKMVAFNKEQTKDGSFENMAQYDMGDYMRNLVFSPEYLPDGWIERTFAMTLKVTKRLLERKREALETCTQILK